MSEIHRFVCRMIREDEGGWSQGETIQDAKHNNEVPWLDMDTLPKGLQWDAGNGVRCRTRIGDFRMRHPAVKEQRSRDRQMREAVEKANAQAIMYAPVKASAVIATTIATLSLKPGDILCVWVNNHADIQPAHDHFKNIVPAGVKLSVLVEGTVKLTKIEAEPAKYKFPTEFNACGPAEIFGPFKTPSVDLMGTEPMVDEPVVVQPPKELQ